MAHSNPPRATCDFETRSACPIRKSGSWKYSLDPSTEILCLAFRLNGWEAGRTSLWHPAFPHLDIPESDNWADLAELFIWIEDGGLVEAHNAFFERGIWANILTLRYGFPSLEHTQWRCSAAKAAAHALPRGLEDAAKALHLSVQKDMAGSKVMKKMAKPRKPRKKELADWIKVHGKAPMPLLWHESKELFTQLWAYCRTDVLAEEAMSEALDDLSPSETELYLLDQAMNERGFQLDRPAVDRALDLIQAEMKILNAELCTLTGGSPAKTSQRAKMLQWFSAQGLILEDTQAATIEDALLDDDLTRPAKRGLELLQLLGKSSTAKYESMRDWMCPDGRVRGGLLYHGATTGRWSGKGVQPHNFPRGTIKDLDIDVAWHDLKTLDRTALSAKYEGVLKVLSHALRGAIIASPGHKLFVADYASIEARVLLWLAEDEEALEVFRRGEDIYCAMASDIYGRRITAEDKTERQMGKQAILGLGYQMGGPKFQATCEKYGIIIEEEFAKQVVDTYREKFWRVKRMWGEQEESAIQATQQARPVLCGYTHWVKEGRFLYCILPSGRRLAYPEPEIRNRQTPWGANKQALTFMGVHPLSRKWVRQATYGGSLVENVDQSVARDCMAEAMVRCAKSAVYTPILTVHDELISEADERGSVKEFESLVAECPEWAEGCPIEASGFSAARYHK